MTSTQVSPDGSWLHGLEEGVAPAAEALARLLPSDQSLVAGTPQTAADVDASVWPAGAVASLASGPGASVAVLVHADLADALAAAPSGGLDLAAAVQPALDAAADAFGSTAGAGRSLTGPAVADLVAGATLTVPLLAGATVAAMMVLTVPTGAASVTSPAPRAAGAAGEGLRGVELLHGVAMEVTVELGRTRLSVRELLALAPGDVLELDRAAGSPADLLVNGRLIARGEVVVVDEDFALRVTEIVAQSRAS
jgi:flagellar motor switch protein FliN/FliY